MANWISCDTNSFGFDTLLMALINQVTDTPDIRGFRVHVLSADTLSTIITCSTNDQWLELFKDALHLETDGEVSLRVMILTTDFEAVENCGVNETLDENLRLTFAKDTNGDTALILFNTAA